jgi:DNA-binding TFAR19-related protein (PDSD5 family)
MTKLLEQALQAVRLLSPDDQDQIALAMLTLTGKQEEPEAVDSEHLPAVLEGLAQAKRREFASAAEVEAAFRRFEQ